MNIQPAVRSRRHHGNGWLLNLVFLLAGILSSSANVGDPPMSFQRNLPAVVTLPQLALPATDVAAELAADAAAGNPAPLRFAVPRTVAFTPANAGTWEQLPDGKLWRLRVVSTNATDLNFGFTRFWLPEGATLYVFSEANNSYQGPYTAADNGNSGQLWTAIVPGDAAVLELFVPAKAQAEPQLLLSQVSTGYRNFGTKWKGPFAKAEGTCNNDVVCPAGAPWTNEIRSVAVYTLSGSWTCSGTLIKDVPGDFRPFFLTANHCTISSANAATVVVYWNYQSTNCGTHGPGSLAQNQTGATFRAAKADVDFCLIELTRIPDASFHVFYSGWDRSGTAPVGCVGIHHPDCNVKAISFSATTLTTVNSCIGSGGVNSHWHVAWSSGVTEPGSSGSGIWNPANHGLVGTLSGGASECGGLDLTDCYGKFAISWASGTTSADRLQNWLDPQNTGVTVLAGSNPASVPAVSAAGATLVAEGCPSTNGVVDPGEVVTVNLSLQNTGTAPTTNLVATLLATNGVIAPSAAQTYGVLGTGGAAVARAFTFMATGYCGGNILPTLKLQDGASSLGSAAFSMTMGIPISSFSQNFDGVTAPALPAGWSSSPSGIWVTTTAQRDSLPNSVFAPNAATVTDYQLLSPQIPITTANAQLSFRHWYYLESGYDGGVLEISIKGGTFTDIVSAGGSFSSGGYSGTISSSFGNPLAGRSAWTGNSGGFVTTTVTLPATAAGGNVQFRWRLGSDSSISATGWYVDSIIITDGYNCCTGAPPTTFTSPFYNRTNRTFQFNVAGGTGYPYAIVTSTNLSNWVALGTNTAPFIFVDSNSVAPKRFYKTRYP